MFNDLAHVAPASPCANGVPDAVGADRTEALERALAKVEAQRRELEAALHARDETQRQLEAELEDARLLHDVSGMLVDDDTVGSLYQKIVDAATLVMRSDFGTMQRIADDTGDLELIAHRGLDEAALRYWERVYPGRATTCGKALQSCTRVVVPDFETCSFIVGSDDLIAFRRAGVRSAQSTPLITRDGRMVGMITTHWTREHAPGERELRLLDIMARQAADLIERNQSAQALRLQAEQLIEADRYKDEFLATLAHELRNPLAPIRTGLSVLAIGKPEQVPRVLSMMERQLGHMVRLVDDLLDVSRVSRGMVTLKRSRIALGTVLDTAVETSRPLINAARHRFSVTVPGDEVWLDADPTRVAQIVSNLLNNAARYTPAGGEIRLVAETAGADVAIHVVDTGIGIPETMQHKIFDLFTQVDRSNERSHGGLGVGLALAKRLAEMHQGSLAVRSPGPDGSSVFTLRLPRAAVAAPVVAESGATRPDGAALRVMVVDDNVDAAETLAMLLEQLGHTVSVVLESPRAVAVALAFRPDVVFLDLGMPQLDGFGLARALRAEPALRHVRLAAISGWGTHEDRSRTEAAGIHRHLTKPVLIGDVVAVLDEAARTPRALPAAA